MNTGQLPQVIRKMVARRRRFRVNYILSKIDTLPKMYIIDIG